MQNYRSINESYKPVNYHKYMLAHGLHVATSEKAANSVFNVSQTMNRMTSRYCVADKLRRQVIARDALARARTSLNVNLPETLQTSTTTPEQPSNAHIPTLQSWLSARTSVFQRERRVSRRRPTPSRRRTGTTSRPQELSPSESKNSRCAVHGDSMLTLRSL